MFVFYIRDSRIANKISLPDQMQVKSLHFLQIQRLLLIPRLGKELSNEDKLRKSHKDPIHPYYKDERFV